MNLMRSSAALGFAAMLAAPLAFAPGAASADPIVLRFAADSPSAGNVCKGYMDVWAKKIEDASDGKLKVELYCDGVLSKIGKTVDAVGSGVADIGWDLPFAYGARFSGLGVSGVPGVYDDPEVASGALWNLYTEGKTGVDFGSDVKLLWVQVVPNTAFYLNKKPVSNTDFTGLKIAMGSKMRATMISAMGGVPVALSPPEYYQAISKGAADGAQSTVGAIAAQKIDELTNTYIYGPFGGGYTFIVMSQKAYDNLPDDLKKVIDDNSGYGMSRWSAAFLRDFENDYLQNVMLKKEGSSYHELTPDEVAAWQKAFDEAAQGWFEQTPGGQQILADYKAEIAKDMKK